MDFKLILGVMILLVLTSTVKSDRWVKLNFAPLCFGAKSNQYGSFNVPYGGKLGAIKLVHLSGYLSCAINSVNHWSFWGCGSLHSAITANHVNVVITKSNNAILLPLNQFFTIAAGKWSLIPGYNSFSPEIVLPFFSTYWVSPGQQFRLWYGEDLMNWFEGDNGGRVCCDAYALYV